MEYGEFSLSYLWEKTGVCVVSLFFYKQKTAYEMRISEWSSYVGASVLGRRGCGENRNIAQKLFHLTWKPSTVLFGSGTGRFFVCIQRCWRLVSGPARIHNLAGAGWLCSGPHLPG